MTDNNENVDPIDAERGGAAFGRVTSRPQCRVARSMATESFPSSKVILVQAARYATAATSGQTLPDMARNAGCGRKDSS